MIMELEKITKWGEFEYLNFINELKEMEDSKYKQFYLKLIKADVNMIGVRIPTLKKIAKAISKGNWEEFIEQIEHKYYEETLIHGFILGYAKIPSEKYFKYMDNFFEFVDNWSVCDKVIANFKFIKKNKKLFFNYVKNLCSSPNVWLKRIGLVIFLNFYIDDNYIDNVIEICSKIDSDDYYVTMAQAWLLCEIFTKYEDNILILFETGILSPRLQNKAIQKIKESLRVPMEKKIFINLFKANK